MRLLILHTVAYLLIGLISLVCTLITPLRWWDLGLSLSFYPEWDKVLYHPWSLVTYALPHLNFFHFFGNMCLVYALLPVMAHRLGTRRFLWSYIGGIIAGALTYLLGYQLLGAQTIPPLSLQGASAAILSVCAAAVMVDRKILSSFTLRFTGNRIPPIALWVFLFLVFLSAGRGNLGGHLAHLGGLLFGIACGLYYRKQAKHPASVFTSDREELLRKARHSSFSSLSPEERRRLMKNLPKDKN